MTPDRRTSTSPLRPVRQSSSQANRALDASILNNSQPGDIQNSLEDQLIQMNHETLEDQVKQLIKDNHELRMQAAADVEQIENL